MAPALVLDGLAVNTIAVSQTETIGPAIIGDANGQPCQSLPLDTDGLIPADDGTPGVTITVDGEEWEQCDRLSASGPADRHVVVADGSVTFGNGVNGRRPALGATVAHGGYRRTAGGDGNLPARGRWRIPALGPDVFGINRHELTGGFTEDSPEELVARARTAGVSKKTALTDEQLVEALAATPGLARVEVLPRFDARVPDTSIDGVRTAVVVPDRIPGVGVDTVYPVAASLLERIRLVLESTRVLGERLEILGASVVLIDVELTVAVVAGCRADEVARDVERLIRRRLCDVRTPSDDGSDAIEPWPLGRSVTSGELQTLATSEAGVATVAGCTVARSRTEERLPTDTATRITLGPTEVAVANLVTVITDDSGGAR